MSSFNIKRVGGVKARRMQEIQDSPLYQKHEGDEPPYLVLIISPIYSRIALFLKNTFNRNKKHIQCIGVDLYRKALYLTTSEESKRVISLIITDRPEDHSFTPAEKLPLWQDTVLRYQKAYLENHQKEIEEGLFPENLTVVTMFRHKRGRLPDDEIMEIEKEFEQLRDEHNFIQRGCESEEEIENMIQKDIVESVVNRSLKMDSIKKFQRSRSQKLAKALKVTNEAHKRNLIDSEFNTG